MGARTLLLGALLLAACSSPKPSGTLPDASPVVTDATGDAIDQRCVVETYDENECDHCENQFCCDERFRCYDDHDCFYGNIGLDKCISAAGDAGADASSDTADPWSDAGDASDDAGNEAGSSDAGSPMEACWKAADAKSEIFRARHECQRAHCQSQCAVP